MTLMGLKICLTICWMWHSINEKESNSIVMAVKIEFHAFMQ